MVLCSWSNIWDGRGIRSREKVLVLLESTVIKFLVSTWKLSFSERKVNLWMRSVSYSKMNTLLFSVFLLFVLTEMYSLSEMKSTFVWERMNNLWVIQDKHYDFECFFFWVVYFSFWPWYVFAFFFDGRNDRCRIVLPFWDTFNIDIDCSVMRLSCLDELVNNQIGC